MSSLSAPRMDPIMFDSAQFWLRCAAYPNAALRPIPITILKKIGASIVTTQLLTQVIPAEKQAQRKSRVLLVQADLSASDGLRRALKRKGHEVVVKTTITDALACVVQEKIGALICDLHLPA